MFNRPAKRKSRQYQNSNYPQHDSALYIQAHEADIICGPQAQSLALSLEAEYAASLAGENKTRLIRWQPTTNELEGSTNTAWIDRYDARLLLETLPSSTNASASVPTSENSRLSPTGWSDLPSDAEDTFFFSPDEADDYHREKRRRMMDRVREERLRALRAEAEEDGDENEREEEWGGSDEEPGEAQTELMRRTANHVMNSPNPAQLEMRILANHGADKRFAFLRGRWSRAWKTMKGRIKLGLEAEKAGNTGDKAKQAALGGLAGYGDSEASEEEEEKEKEGTVAVAEMTGKEDAEKTLLLSEEAAKEARRARAKEWMEKRKQEKLITRDA